MVRNVETKVFSYDELDEKAQERAMDWYYNNVEYAWFQSSVDTMEAFASLMNARVIDYRIGGGRDDMIRWEHRWDDEVAQMEGARLWKYLHNQTDIPEAAAGAAPLTGYILDEEVLEPLRAFLKKPSAGTSIEDLIQEGFENLRIEVERDVEYHYSEEAAEEWFEANEVEFTEGGRPF